MLRLTIQILILQPLPPQYFEDLCDRAFLPMSSNEGDPGGISDISYSLTGTTGSRICMIQVNNAGFFGEIYANDTSKSFINFQLWLYEGTNDIEIHFGNVNIQNPNVNLANSMGFRCGLGEQVNLNSAANLSANVLSGISSSPLMVGLTSTLNEVVTGTIQSGRVYKFARVNPNATGIASSGIMQQFSLFPNPTSKMLYCKEASETMKDA